MPLDGKRPCPLRLDTDPNARKEVVLPSVSKVHLSAHFKKIKSLRLTNAGVETNIESCPRRVAWTKM